MKNKIIMAIVSCFLMFQVDAQIIDDMEYENGEPLGEWWYNCANQGADCISISTAQARSGTRSGYIPDNGTTEAIFDLGSQIFGQWGMEFYMYVPSNKEAYWNLQGELPVGQGEWIVGNIFFNQDLASPGVGLIDDSALGSVNFTFPHDEWFRVVMNWDLSSGISTATWEFEVADNTVIPAGTPFTDNGGNTATSLGGIDFFSISANNEFWLDDFYYTSGFIDTIDGFTDDMEYPTTEACAPWWTTWTGENCPEIISAGGANGTNKSGYISGNSTVDPVLNLGNQTSGEWNLHFYMYVPSGKEGYFNLQGEVPISGGEWIVGNIFFNQDLASPGVGLIDNSALGEVSFAFPHDGWFEVNILVDMTAGISNATWQFFVDEFEVIPLGTPFTNSAGIIPTSLGGLNFLPLSNNVEYYIDEFNYSNGILGVNDETKSEFAIFPNPSNSIVNIVSQETISAIKVYNLQGILIMEHTDVLRIDMSPYSSGVYFIEVTTNIGTSTKKLVKK